MTDKLEEFEEKLSQIVGDPLAFQIGYRLRDAKQKAGKQAQDAKQMLVEYLKYELDLAPSRAEVEAFGKEVTELTENLDALSDKIQALIK